VRWGANRIGFEVGAYDTTRPLVIDPVLSYATYFGGSGFNVGRDITMDRHGQAYVVGTTGSRNFPLIWVRVGPISIGRNITLDSDGRTYLTGATDSEDFPIKNPLQFLFGGDSNAFVVRIAHHVDR
jgi:hypothetical protein